MSQWFKPRVFQQLPIIGCQMVMGLIWRTKSTFPELACPTCQTVSQVHHAVLSSTALLKPRLANKYCSLGRAQTFNKCPEHEGKC